MRRNAWHPHATLYDIWYRLHVTNDFQWGNTSLSAHISLNASHSRHSILLIYSTHRIQALPLFSTILFRFFAFSLLHLWIMGFNGFQLECVSSFKSHALTLLHIASSWDCLYIMVKRVAKASTVRQLNDPADAQEFYITIKWRAVLIHKRIWSKRLCAVLSSLFRVTSIEAVRV